MNKTHIIICSLSPPRHPSLSPNHAVAITQGGAIQLANNGTDGVQGLHTLTMTNAAAAAQPGATILQYAQTSDGQQILVPSNQVVVQGERVLFSYHFISMSWCVIGLKLVISGILHLHYV